MNKLREKEKLRYLFWRKGWVAQHKKENIGNWLDGSWSFSQSKQGNIKNGEGDIVLINLRKEYNHNYDLKEYLLHCYDIDKIETKGIYTNIYFGNKFFNESLKEINK